MIIAPSMLAMVTTYKCTASCDHCCFSCSPKNSQFMPYDRMIRLIDEASAIPSIKLVAFTGGECFLLGDKLDVLVGHASHRGLITRCISNGYWARTRNDAEKRVRKLVASGLNEINLSTGGIHYKYVPVERVINAARASVNAGLTTLINVETFSESTFEIGWITQHPELSQMIQDKKLLIHVNNWIMTHGKANITHPPDRSRFLEANKSGCSSCLDSICVTPDLELMACCGFMTREIPELSIGSVKDRTISDILSSAEDDLLKMWIRVEGPERVLDFVKKHDECYQIPGHFAHPCESCRYIYHDEATKEILQEHYHEIEDRVTSLYLVEMATKEMSARCIGKSAV